MANTLSTMIPLGTRAPDFRLPDTRSNQLLSLQELKSDTATVIMFLCNHCPFVKHIQTKLVETADIYQAKDVHFIAISSNDAVAYPQDGPELMRKEADTQHYSFPYLYDETQETAHAYGATCTPDFFIFDNDLLCVYRGRFDDSTPGNGVAVTGRDMREALEAILAGKPVNPDQQPSIGCNIKWKKK